MEILGEWLFVNELLVHLMVRISFKNKSSEGCLFKTYVYINRSSSTQLSSQRQLINIWIFEIEQQNQDNMRICFFAHIHEKKQRFCFVDMRP